LHLSKGVHVVLPRETLPVHNIVIVNAGDGRSIFVVPRGEVVYVGTTDTSYDGGHDWWPPIEGEDVDYLLAPLERTFRVRLGRDDVVGAWAGLRPLIAEAGKGSTEISRKDEVWTGPGGMVTIAGGKLTGYRPMARGAVERAAAETGLALQPAPAEDPPLPGGDFDGDLDALATELVRRRGVDRPTAARLVRLYGAEADAVAGLGARALGSHGVEGEVDWAVAEEGALYLEDVVYRRMRTALYARDSHAGLEACARRMGARLGWREARVQQETASVRERLLADVAFRGETSARMPSREEGAA
jgi:glycerol-3-phosphate dehydrogenase